MSDNAEMVTNRVVCAYVVGILGEGAMSRGVEIGISVVILGFVDCQLFCCILI